MKNDSGFTLLEILLGIAISSLLILVVNEKFFLEQRLLSTSKNELEISTSLIEDYSFIERLFENINQENFNIGRKTIRSTFDRPINIAGTEIWGFSYQNTENVQSVNIYNENNTLIAIVPINIKAIEHSKNNRQITTRVTDMYGNSYKIVSKN